MFLKSNYVAKLFNSNQHFNNELDIMKEIQRRINPHVDQHFISMIFAHKQSKTLVYAPYGKQMLKLNKDRFHQMLSCLSLLQKNGIIHRDLSPNHFLVRNENGKDQVFIIDFGSAYLAPLNSHTEDMNNSKNAEGNLDIFKGSIQFAALEILQNLRDQK